MQSINRRSRVISSTHTSVGISPRVLRLLIWSLAMACFVWAWSGPQFRDAEGFLTGKFCLPIATGMALMTLGWAVMGQWQNAAFWFALALVGQAVSLQMIDAGQVIRYQHYKPFNRLVEIHPLLLLYLVVQTALVVAGLIRHWSNVRAWINRTFKMWQLLGVGLIFILSSATVSREIPVYIAELPFAAFVQAVNLVNILLVALALPEEALASLRRKFETWFGQQTVGNGIDRFAVLAALWVTLLAAVLSFYSYERHPHVPDEVGYLYNARYFADGMLAMPAPPAPDAFDVDLMYYAEDRWFSAAPPGWPLALAIGVLFGMPWLVNPLLAGINVLLTYIFLREIYDRRASRLALILLCISPWHVFMAMNFMTHTFALTCALVAAVAVAWARKTNRAMWGLLGGCAVGMVSLIRPLEGLGLGALLGLWVIGIGGRRLKASSIAAFVLGAVAVGSAVLPYNKLLTGDPTRFPIMAYTDKHYGPKSNALGFGPERGLGWQLDPFPGHGPLDALVNANLNISSINTELFGWSSGSLILIALLLFSMRMRRSDYLMLAVIIVIFGLHCLYWFSGGPDFGARYWYLMLIPCVALTVSGIRFLEGKLGSGPTVSSAHVRVMVVVLSLCALSVLNYFPWRAIDKYHHYLGMRPDIRRLAQEYSFGKSVVLIRGNRHPDYASAAIYNPVDLRADATVYAWDRSPEARSQVLNAYSDRPVWIVNGPSITHAGFKVAEGPLPAAELLAKQNEK